MVKRAAARALVFNSKSEILLIKIKVPDTGWTGWITPGGGIDLIETPIDSLKRELWEELGISEGFQMGTLVGKRRHNFRFFGREIDQTEFFYPVFLDPHSPPILKALNDIEDYEKQSFVELRFWSFEALKQTSELISPPTLVSFLEWLGAEKIDRQRLFEWVPNRSFLF